MEKKLIDVSVWQGVIDWAQVKPNIDGAIIRCSNGATDNTTPDPQFERNANECERLGIPYGVYVFSYATSEAAAIKEAEYCVQFLKGRKLSYPVFFDSEDRSTASMAAVCARAFLRTVEAAGYVGGVYASASWWRNYLQGVETRARFVASWGSNSGNPEMNYKPAVCDIWQYTSNGSIPGISGRVDRSLCYVDYPAICDPEPVPDPEPEPQPDPDPAPGVPVDWIVEKGGAGEFAFEQKEYAYTYEKHASGLLVVTVSDWYGAAVGKTYGSGYFVEKLVSFPTCVRFIEPPRIFLQPRAKQNLLSAMPYAIDTKAASVWVYGTQKAIPRFSMDALIVGHWK